MSNRVIKDLIWTSPKLAECSMRSQLHFPRLILLSDDWGCFNADPEVIKGLAYPKIRQMTSKKISEILKELYDKGLLFLWKTGHHKWGFWMKWEEHNFASGSEYSNGGERVKHRRKTPIPPEEELKKYISEHLGTDGDNLEKSESNPNPNPKHNPNKDNVKQILTYLNEKTGKHFRTDAQNFISGRLNDGYTIDDCKKVIDIKTAQWLNDSKMKTYLRPSTLFRESKFEAYLNEEMPVDWKKKRDADAKKIEESDDS